MAHEDAVVVEMTAQTVHMYNGNLYRLWPGMQVEVPSTLAAQWQAVGLANPVKGSARKAKADEDEEKAAQQGPVQLGDHRAMQRAEAAHAAQSDARKEVVRTDLRIASNHGDVAAARRLDAMGEPGERPTNAPLTLTDEGAPDFGAHDRPPETTMPQPVSPEARAARAAADEGGGAAPRQSTGASARSALGGGGKG